MARSAFAALVALVASSAACSLLTSVDGLSGEQVAEAVDGGDASISKLDADVKPESGTTDGGGLDSSTPSQAYAVAVLADKPLGYWRLEGSDVGNVKDEVGTHNATFTGAPVFGEPGVAGSHAAKLPSGQSSRVSVPSSAFRFPGNAPYAVELWLKAGVVRDFTAFASTEVPQVGSLRNGWTILGDGEGAVRYEVWAFNGDGGAKQVRGCVPTTTRLAAGAFHHLVVTYTGTQVIGYFDGAQQSVITMPAAAPDVGELSWGCRGDGSMCLDDWTIDELAIYDHVLVAGRVSAHYQLGR